MYTVYKTTNLLNNKIYIGVHKTENIYDNYLGSGLILKQALKLYGRENFKKEILFCFDNLVDAYAKEKELVNQEFVLREDTYNVTVGGSVSINWDKERKETHAKNISGSNHPMFGKKHKPETIEKIRQKGYGRKHSEEFKKAMSERLTGMPSVLKGRPQSKESNEKRSAAHKTLAKITCPHCNKTVSPQNGKRWHFNNCPKYHS
jgi:hypothetical protein